MSETNETAEMEIGFVDAAEENKTDTEAEKQTGRVRGRSVHHGKRVRKIQERVFAVLGVLLFLAVAVMFAIYANREEEMFKQGENELGESTATEAKRNGEITYINGEAYTLKNDVSAYLIFGIDTLGKFTASGSNMNTNQCDFLLVLVIDSASGTYRVIPINRDTITNVRTINALGEYAGTEEMQIALSHTYGDGLGRSCLNTKEAVSELLYGITITRYYAMTMEAVPILNDYVGGVTVTIDEDLTVLDPTFTEGATVTLHGEKALSYVRARMSVSDGTNISRMKRQEQYVNSMLSSIPEEQMTKSFISGAFESVEEYSYTDMNLNDMYVLAHRISSGKFEGTVPIDGESVFDGTYMRFYVDEESLKNVIVELFYDKAE